MAPIKFPKTLQSLSMQSTCELLLNYAAVYHELDFERKRFQRLETFVVEQIPPLLRSMIFHSALKNVGSFRCENSRSELIILLVKFLINSEIHTLNFSDLILAGDVSYEELDYFEMGISQCLPYMPHLTSLDLSTHKNDVTLPSCSNEILNAISCCCPNLRVLNLNNNNRVTDEGIKCLMPSGSKHGCPYLEEIFLIDCSITDFAIVWLLITFTYLKRIGWAHIGRALASYDRMVKRNRQRHSYHRRYHGRHHYEHVDMLNPHLRLTMVDNSESARWHSDRDLIDLMSRLCPELTQARVRISDSDCAELYKCKGLLKLELRFYTGVYHIIGTVTRTYLRDMGHKLTCLALICNELESYNVNVVVSSCKNLQKLFVQCNKFFVDRQFDTTLGELKKLEVLNIRIGLHEMDESEFAPQLARFLLERSPKLQELYLLLICKNVHRHFLESILATNSFPDLKIFVYDAPRRNRDLPVIPLKVDSASLLLEKCASLKTIGNLISWQVSEADVERLKYVLAKKNYDANIIYSAVNKLNEKYF